MYILIRVIKMENLKPCPFCGGKITIWDTSFGVVSVVECKSCKTRFVFPWDRKAVDLFEFWNRRAEETEERRDAMS